MLALNAAGVDAWFVGLCVEGLLTGAKLLSRVSQLIQHSARTGSSHAMGGIGSSAQSMFAVMQTTFGVENVWCTSALLQTCSDPDMNIRI